MYVYVGVCVCVRVRRCLVGMYDCAHARFYSSVHRRICTSASRCVNEFLLSLLRCLCDWTVSLRTVLNLLKFEAIKLEDSPAIRTGGAVRGWHGYSASCSLFPTQALLYETNNRLI